ncbi:acyl-CoA dehydrogenase [Cribrihabitans pelagius]|uniref:acyl-CoA dehydrogenase n=1 Tax=Cribrihabitans pelagius TaxID=1765746 RepID=UPI003B5B8269
MRPDAENTADALPFGRHGVPGHVLAGLLEGAAAEEQGARPISRSIALLREAGLLTDDGTADPARTARALMRIGAANLSVGRLWEGHVNALHLIRLYGDPDQRSAVHGEIANGAFLGVWGADGADPVTVGPTGSKLSGRKRFASGLGTVSHAVVTVNSGPEVRLALIGVGDLDRADPFDWDMQGMKATASGSYDFTGLAVDSIGWIGAPGDYLKEPHFAGGVWRIAALQTGGAVGLVDAASAQLRSLGRMQAEAQKSRLMTALAKLWAGMAMTERAAQAAARGDLDAERVVCTSTSARLFTEEAALDAIRAVEQSLGLGHFAEGCETGRMARDLSVYLRQAARDAFLQRAAEHALGHDRRVWGVFG